MQALGRRQSALRLYFSGRIVGLSVYQHALMAFAGWFFVFTAIGDTYQISGTLLFEQDSIRILVIGLIVNVLFVSVFFVFPCAFAGWGIYHIKTHDRHISGVFPQLKFLIIIIGWIVSTFVCVLCPLAVFVLVDMFAANSVIPLTTVFAGIVWLILGTNETRKLPLNRRIIIVTSMLLLILSIKYIDWSPKKSFVRDLLQIRKGMTGVQVEKIMRNQQKNFVQPESEHFLHLNPEYTGSTVFRDDSREEYASVAFINGRVVNIVFDNY
jgi:hypothetical protein